MKKYLICPNCANKVEANIIKRDVLHASWGGDYQYSGCDATNRCTACDDEHPIRADFWLDNFSLKEITNIPFPKVPLIWYALAEVRGNLEPNEDGIVEKCQINITRIFDKIEEAEELKVSKYQHYSLVKLLTVTAEGFRNEEGHLLQDPYQTDTINFSRVSEEYTGFSS